jgi:tetratricopeptide (TPR) repeat protein
VESAVTCASCGAKFKADYTRCPRCRTKIAVVDPAAVAASSRRLKWIGASITIVALTGFAGVWLVAPSDQPAMPVKAKTAGGGRATPAGGPAATTASPHRPFMDASGAAYESYQSGDFEAALKHYQAAIARNPHDPEALSNLGQVLVRLNRTREALPYFTKAIELNPDRWAYTFNRARAEGLLEQWTDCIADYRRAQQLFPGDYATIYNLALALHKSGDEEAAVIEYQKAIDLAPQDATFRRALAISLERLTRNAEAAAAYTEYLKLSPNADDADKVRERIAVLTGTGTAATKTAEAR